MAVARHSGRAADAAIPGARLQRHQRVPVSHWPRVGNLRLEGHEENTRRPLTSRVWLGWNTQGVRDELFLKR